MQEGPIEAIDNQMGRRNIADIDRIDLRRKKAEIVRKLAKENLKTSTGGSIPWPLAILPKAAINTRKIQAKSAGVGERTYDAGVAVLEAHDKGKVSDSDAASIVKLGQMLEKNPPNKGMKGKKFTGSKMEPVKDDTPTLADQGLDKKISSRSKMLAPAREGEPKSPPVGDLNSVASRTRARG